jgi:hypothetical protein
VLDVGLKVNWAYSMLVRFHHSLYLLLYALNVLSDLLDLCLSLLERSPVRLSDPLQLAHEHVLGLLKHFDAGDLFPAHGLASLCDLPLEVERGAYRLMHHVFSHLRRVLCIAKAGLGGLQDGDLLGLKVVV